MIRLFAVAIILSIMACMFSGCYHLRISAEPLKQGVVKVAKSSWHCIPRIRKVLEDDLHLRILEEEHNGTVLVTAPLHFATDTGFGQPAGGRQYYVQFRVETASRATETEIKIIPYHYDLRTSYAYAFEGHLRVIYKIYPYEQYPGMFDLKYLENEISRISSIIEQALKE